MDLNKLTTILDYTVKIDKEFKNFYYDIIEILREVEPDFKSCQFQIEKGECVFLFDIFDDDLVKNQKQTLFLISKYSKDKNLLFNSYRVDVELSDKPILTIVNWAKLENDYRTRVKHIILNEYEFSI